MRLFNFLLKFTFICNIAFLLFVFFRWMELRQPVHEAAGDGAGIVVILKDLVIVLGMSAIVINILMNIFYFLYLARGKHKNISIWLPPVNFLFLLVQIFYFFFY